MTKPEEKTLIPLTKAQMIVIREAMRQFPISREFFDDYEEVFKEVDDIMTDALASSIDKEK
ncbi:hypothetical protein [Ralstonia phage RSP15]|uniref:hypothetical protein n=1 Tax=Ralstonia phage RSP15 TaxID=1785960 RepID=UPI00074D3686|nr:hypothetical protein BH754_gp101 [Ralstonia phage RSP15]BAU40059.1 hypothetical protein [Ralstonia phage RSP15]